MIATGVVLLILLAVIFMVDVSCAPRKPVKPTSWHCEPSKIDAKTRSVTEYECTSDKGEHWRMSK